jgi:hypothetical protein
MSIIHGTNPRKTMSQTLEERIEQRRQAQHRRIFEQVVNAAQTPLTKTEATPRKPQTKKGENQKDLLVKNQ